MYKHEKTVAVMNKRISKTLENNYEGKKTSLFIERPPLCKVCFN